MNKKPSKIFDIRNGKLCFLGIPLNIRAVPDSGHSDSLYVTGALNAFKGLKLPRGLAADNLKKSISLALFETGKCAPAYIPNVVTILGIDLLPQSASQAHAQPEPSTEPESQAGLQNNFTNNANPSPTDEYDCDVKVGKWGFDTNANTLLFNGKPTTQSPHVIAAFKELLVNFPAPLAMSTFKEKAASISREEGMQPYSESMLYDFVLRAAQGFKRNGICPSNPIKIDNANERIYLRTDLKGLTPEQQEKIGAVHYQHIAVSVERNGIWQDGVLVDNITITPQQLRLMGTLIENSGQYIEIEDIPEITSTIQITALSKRFRSLNLPEVKTHQGDNKHNKVTGLALCTDEEWPEILAEYKQRSQEAEEPQAAKKPQGSSSLPNPWADDIPHAPQFL